MKNFKKYIEEQRDSVLWESEGDEERNAKYYQTQAASCFFPVAARNLVKDGLDGGNIAAFCVEGALEALKTSGLSLADAENRLMQIVLKYRMSEEISDQAQS